MHISSIPKETFIKWDFGIQLAHPFPNHPLISRMARHPNQVLLSTSTYSCHLEISSVSDVFGVFVWDVIIFAIACVGCVLSLILLLIILGNRRHPAIVIAPLVYLVTLIVGAIILFVSLIVIYIPPTSFTCFFKLVLILLGVSIINGCVLAKAQRYFCIYTRTSKKTPVMRWPELFIVVAIIIILNGIILALAFSIGGTPKPVIAPQLETTNVLFITCTIQPSGWQLAIIIIGIVFNIFLLALSAVLLLSAREQRTRYNDQHYLTYFACNFIIVGIILTILYFLQESVVAGIVRKYIIRALAILLVGFGVLFFLIAPKLLYLWRSRKEEERRRRQQAQMHHIDDGRHANQLE